MKTTRYRSLYLGLAASLLGVGAPAVAGPDDPIFFDSPVTGDVFLNNPDNFPYQVYQPSYTSGPGTLAVANSLTITNGALIRYGGAINNTATLVLGRTVTSSGTRTGAIAMLGSGSPITFSTTPDSSGVLRMLGGSIYSSFNHFFPDASTARVTNGPGHLITNSDGPDSPSYSGRISGVQLTNEGDIYSVRPGGVLSLSLSALRNHFNALGNQGGAGSHYNTASGRIAAYDSGRINISVRGAGGVVDAPNRFINDGLITTRDPMGIVSDGSVVGMPSSGGTIRLSSLTIPNDPRPAGSFEGNNPVVTWGGRLELSEIRFINTLPPATIGGTRTGKTLAATDGTIVIENQVTVEGGRIEGNTTNRRFEIGNLNTFLGVEFNGTFFAGGRQRLLEGTDISGADFRQLGGSLFLDLGSNQTLGVVRNHQGDVRFASDDPTNRRTLTLGADLYGSGSLGFANLVLAGSGNVDTPEVRIGPNLDLSGYSGVLRPNLGNPFGGGQLRLEGLTITAPLSPKLSYANSTLVLDNSTFDLDGSRLTPASTYSALRLENNSTLRNGTLNATGTNVTVASSRLQQLALTGGTIDVETAIALDRVQPGTASEFNGTDYTVTLGAATTPIPLWDLAGGTLRFNTAPGGTVSLDTAGPGVGLPTNGRIAADRIRLIGNLAVGLPNASFAAGPSGSLHLIVGDPAYTFTNSGALNVSGGDLRLDYAARSFPNPPPGQMYLNAITVDGRLTVTNAVTLKPRNDAYYIGGSTYLPAAASARAFTLEGGDLSGLHLRSFVPGGVANVDLNSYATTVLAAADTTTHLNGGKFVIGDPNFVYDPLNPATPTATAQVRPPGTGISTAGQVSADGTLVFSGVALSGAVSESVTASGSSYLPRILPSQSLLGTITAQNITLSNGTVAGMRYENYQDVVSGNQVRRWTQAPNLVATGDPNLGTPGVLRFETGRYALEDNFTYGQLVIGNGATLARQSALVPGFVGFVGDPLAADPDVSPLPDTAAMMEFRAIGFNRLPPAQQQHELVFDGGRIEGLTLLSLPEPFSYGSGRSGVLALSRATFAANSSLIGTLDHDTGAVTRFEGGYTFAPNSVGSYTGDAPRLLRPAAGLTGADRRFGIEIAALGSSQAEATVTVPVETLLEESTRLEGDVTVTGVADPSSSTRARLELLSNGTSFQPWDNLHHSEGTLTFAGDLNIVVDGRLRSEDQIVFAAGTELFGTGKVEAVNGITLNGQTLPGNSPGKLTLVGDVTFGATQVLVLDIGFDTFESDQLVIDGDLTVGGKLALNFYYGFNSLNLGYFNGSAPLLRANSFLGSFSSYEVLGLNDPSDFNPSQFEQILPAGLIVAVPVPEPSTYALFCAGGWLYTAVIRRRRLAPTPS